jgi:hypothetical protein
MHNIHFDARVEHCAVWIWLSGDRRAQAGAYLRCYPHCNALDRLAGSHVQLRTARGFADDFRSRSDFHCDSPAMYLAQTHAWWQTLIRVSIMVLMDAGVRAKIEAYSMRVENGKRDVRRMVLRAANLHFDRGENAKTAP